MEKKQPAAFLLNLIRQLFQPSPAQDRQQAYLQLIQAWLRCSNHHEQGELLARNQELIDKGLIETMQQIGEEFDRQGNIVGKKLKNMARILYINFLKPQPEKSYFNFIKKTLQKIRDGANKRQILDWLEQNKEIIDINLAHALEVFAATTVSIQEQRQKQVMGWDILDFGNRIQEFSLGNKKINTQIAFICFGICLSIFDEDDYPSDWATTQHNLGTAYLNRSDGDIQKNIELAIVALTSASKVYTKENDSFHWANNQFSLANAYKNRTIGNKKKIILL